MSSAGYSQSSKRTSSQIAARSYKFEQNNKGIKGKTVTVNRQNIEITDNRVNLKIDLNDEDIEFLKIHPENYTIINFYSELLLILRFIRNKEANTIGR